MNTPAAAVQTLRLLPADATGSPGLRDVDDAVGESITLASGPTRIDVHERRIVHDNRLPHQAAHDGHAAQAVAAVSRGVVGGRSW